MRKRAKIPSLNPCRAPLLESPTYRVSGSKSTIRIQTPQVLPWAAARIKEAAENNGKDAPHNHCLPVSPVPCSSAPFIAKFVQTASLLVILFEDTPGFRFSLMAAGIPQLYFQPGWGIPSASGLEYALVVDTVGFNVGSPPAAWAGAGCRIRRCWT